jgi:hypothetical protein
MIGKDLERSGRGLIFRYYPDICLVGLKKTTKLVSHDSQSPDQDLNPEYEARMTATRPQRLVTE